MQRLILGIVLALGVAFNAFAQGQQQCFTTNGNNCIKVGTGAAGSGSDPLPVEIFGSTTIIISPDSVINTQDLSDGLVGNTVPNYASYAGANSSGLLKGIIQADNTTIISINSATTTQLVALSSGKKIYVTAWDIIAGGAGNFTLVYGTGSNCASGTTNLTGTYNLTAQAGIAKGNGLGPVIIVPASNALCALTSAAVNMGGSLAYTQAP